MPDSRLTAPSTTAPSRFRLASAIRAAISDGTLQPGERVNERELCETHGVSRTTVRETLRQLEAEGFLTLEPHRGAVVARMSYAQAEALFEVREALESLACGLFAARGDLTHKRRLSEALKATEAAMQGGSLDEVLEVKDRFYDALLDGAGNPELTTSLRLLHARIRMLRRYSLSVPGRHERTLAEITDICRAIVAGDVEGARRAGSRHVAQARYAALPTIFAQEEQLDA
ncbi:GntR family transcriptional regulator [Streptomyces sp. ISL-12]|uniref:GntR family transcriptional regulator n=1 Tax=Streptomyces sp. ISL-12 TaxID=2819177 RepID=UPI001BE5A631|nr:GntR family transcriptional regulator [Streptomyces sp. ISL-12]MBT2412482.1 GntR family transcriptional regulator [Streptomyces sp. ISL-12]